MSHDLHDLHDTGGDKETRRKNPISHDIPMIEFANC